MIAENLNLTALLGLRKDRYAKAQGAFSLRDGFEYIGNGPTVWTWMRQKGGLQMRIAYLCEDGKRRDIIGRAGVHNSKQDGKVAGTGHAMADRANLTLSFWTCVFDATGKESVNTGTGQGYRTIRADRILAVNLEQGDKIESQHITTAGQILLDTVC